MPNRLNASSKSCLKHCQCDYNVNALVVFKKQCVEIEKCLIVLLRVSVWKKSNVAILSVSDVFQITLEFEVSHAAESGAHDGFEREILMCRRLM